MEIFSTFSFQELISAFIVLFAVIDIIKNAIQKKELGEITIFGHEVHDDPHIK